MKRGFWLALAAWLLIGFGVTAPAHAAGGTATYSVWAIDGGDVRVRFILPMTAAKLLVPDMPRLDAAHASAAAGMLLGATSSAGDCPPVIQNQWVGEYYILAPENGAYRFEMMFQCPSTSGIVLHNRVLFEQRPDHIGYASVQIGRGKPSLHLFSRTHETLAIPAGGALGSESLGPFARQGLGLILRDAAAAALVAGMLLLARRWRDLIAIAAALALGYAAALAVVWSSNLAPNLAFAQAGMGAAAAILGVCALRRHAGEQATPRGWLIGGLIAAALAGACLAAVGALKGWTGLCAAAGLVVFGVAEAWIAGARPRSTALLFAPGLLFGLLDGVVWAERLTPLQMPGRRVASALFGYDLGAVAGLVGVAALAMALLWAAGRRLRTLQPFGADLAAATLTGLGLFWFVSRLYGV